MHRDPKSTDSSLRGNEAHKRDRKVHKLRLGDIGDLSPERVAELVATGDIELIVRRSELGDAGRAEWRERMAKLFDMVAQGLEGTPEHVNRTVIVNLLAQPWQGDDEP